MEPRLRALQMDELPRPRLDEQLKMSHPLIRLASLMNLQEVERSFGAQGGLCRIPQRSFTYFSSSTLDRPLAPGRFM